MISPSKTVQLSPAAADFISSHPELKKTIGQVIRRLAQNPLEGIPLKGVLKGLRKKRVGDHRIIYSFTTDTLSVVNIRHRKDVYR